MVASVGLGASIRSVILEVFALGGVLGTSWRYLGSSWPPRRPQDPPRRLEDPPKRLQEPPRYPQDPPTGGQKTLIFLVFFKVFAFVGLLGAILAQHGLQDDVKSLQNAFKGLQDASKSLQDGSTSLQNAPKSLQDAPKTPPESSQNRAFHNVFQYIPLSWAFLGPSCSTWPSKRLQSPPKRLQDPPESLQDTPRASNCVAKHQGWSGGGSPA